MTKDYEVDAIEEEVRREVQLEMQSPYTRAEFIRDLITDGWGEIAAERGADAAERAGIVWRQKPRPEVAHVIGNLKDEIRKLIQEEISAFNRQSLTPRLKTVDSRTEAAIESADSAHTFLRGHDARITPLERQIARLETHRDWVLGTLTVRVTELGARLAELQTAIGNVEAFNIDEEQAIVERIEGLETKLEHTIRESHTAMKVERDYLEAQDRGLVQRIARVESEWQIEGQKLAADRQRLRSFVVDGVGKDLETVRGRVDQIASRLDDAHDLATSVWNSLHSNAFREQADPLGLLELVRRLDADVALLRDAAVLPPGANRDDPYWNADAELVKAMHDQYRAELQTLESAAEPAVDWPDPTPAMLESTVFEAVWQVIRTWDIAVPGAYTGYCGATGNHVRAILDGVGCLFTGSPGSIVDRLGRYAEHLRQTREALRAACRELGADSQWSAETSLADVVSKVLMPAIARRIADEIG